MSETTSMSSETTLNWASESADLSKKSSMCAPTCRSPSEVTPPSSFTPLCPRRKLPRRCGCHTHAHTMLAPPDVGGQHHAPAVRDTPRISRRAWAVSDLRHRRGVTDLIALAASALRIVAASGLALDPASAKDESEADLWRARRP
eukprot:1970408-Rhodomonas_salina.3